MIVVDTSVWVAYFNGQANPHADRLDVALIREEHMAILPIIVTETLQGFRTDSGFRKAKQVLLSIPLLIPSMHAHVRAAALFRLLRSKGVTVRGAIDCIVAQSCLDHGAELLSMDGDFKRIAEHTRLKLCAC
ncbi:MAG: PIN domain nuclease [Planctomycetes bacterium]|nr:PIN domain nuclease [Planctomycetota bacterium]MBI3848478.1 PIN domain nuclease [Planctomycetota bacterium]